MAWPRAVGIVCVLALVLGATLLSGPARAERYHVSLDGTRTAGASLPGDWSAANCYASLAAAAAAAAPDDSLLLSRETHTVETPIELARHLGNRDLDDDPAGCRLDLTLAGELVVDESSVDAVIAGIALHGDTVARDVSAIHVSNPSRQLQTVTVRGCTFQEFHGGRPGGGPALRASDGGGLELHILGCSFDGNATFDRGGAVRIDDGFRVVFEDCSFTGNQTMSGQSSSPYGGAIHVLSPTDPTHVTIRRTDLQLNRSAMIGGAICLFDASLVMEESQVRDNESAWDGQTSWCAGAGVMLRRNEGTHHEPVELVVSGCEFSGNVGNLEAGDGAGDGGGIMVRGSLDRLVDVTVEFSDFFDNYNDQGAGLYIGRFTNGIVSYCRFHRNATRNSGGATFKGGGRPENLGEMAEYRFCEFIDNVAGVTEAGDQAWAYARGGAFSTRERTRARFYHCTFVNNVIDGLLQWGDAISHYDEGNSFDDDLERLELVNCVFWGDQGNDVQVRSDALGFSLVSHCAWQEGQFVCSGVEPVASAVLSTLPFASVQNPVPLPGSPLVDAGFDLGLTPDLVGTPVPQGAAPDIGAYETLQTVDAPPTVADEAVLVAYPNPFNPVTVLTAELGAPAGVAVEVLDVRGRRVAVIHRGQLDAGVHQWRWDGRDDQGRVVPGGTYVARLSAGDQVAIRKLTLIK